MIKRLADIARANVGAFIDKRNGEKADPLLETQFAPDEKIHRPQEPPDPLASYYAHLEIPSGSGRKAVKSAWKRMLKKYHPDLHDADPEKRKTADELTRRLTESYRLLDKELSKRG